MSLLKLDYCGKKFSRGNTVIGAVQPTAAAFDKGVHAIYGNGGAGKSTLLHMMAGMEPPSDGKVYFDGASVYDDLDLPELYRREFAFLYAEDNLVPEFNVRDNIRLPLQFQRERGDGSLEKLTEELNLTGMLTMRPQSLSEEQQLRAAIAMALIRRPRIVFADDITAHLHTDEAAAIAKLLVRQCRAAGAMLIWATADEAMTAYADQVYTMTDGRLAPRA